LTKQRATLRVAGTSVFTRRYYLLYIIRAGATRLRVLDAEMQNVPTLKISAAIKLTEGFLTGTNRNRRRLQKADKGNRMSFGASTSHGRRIRHGAHVYVGLTMGTLLSASQ